MNDPMILVATCDAFEHPTPSLDRLLQAINSQGVRAEHRAWRRTPVKDFAAADLVLPLCFWDHHGALQYFLRWVDAVEAAGGRLINSPDILRWNFRKTYLLDLLQAGLAVPPTVHIPDIDTSKVAQVMRTEQWPSVVIKPVSGQDGHDMVKLQLEDREQWPDLYVPQQEALVQAFQPDITTFGETTLTFFEGEFSHAVQRHLRAGEWRANQQFGVEVEAITVSEATIEAAKRYLDLVPGRPVYARADGIVRPHGFMLMELELIDPYLYLEIAPAHAAEKLAKALTDRLNGPVATRKGQHA